MIVAYSKLGRSWNLDTERASTVGGDLDVIRLLKRISWAHPEHTFILVGRNSGDDPQRLGFPDNVVNPWCKNPSVPSEYEKFNRWVMPKLDYDHVSGSPGACKEYLARCESLVYGRAAHVIGSHIMWMGQHGGSNSPLPQIGYDWEDCVFTKPQMSFLNYCAYLLDFCNISDVSPVALCPDPRNYWKARELMRPLAGPVLAQHDETRPTKHEQYGNWDLKGYEGMREKSVLVTTTKYVYSALELTALDDPPAIFCNTTLEGRRHTFGLVSNENRREVTCDRLSLVKQWVLPHFPDAPIYGSWSEESMLELKRQIVSVPTSQMYDVLRSFKFTVTLPASGSGWATAKPWECFAVGTLCFFHPKYDDQGHVLPHLGTQKYREADSDTQFLSDWLRVNTPEEMLANIDSLSINTEKYRRLLQLQRELFERRFVETRGGMKMIEEAAQL